MSRDQLRERGFTEAAISRWTALGRLHRIHPGVYAVCHRAIDLRGRLLATLLYAGDRSALSHQTAAWWWGLLKHEPRRIHVSTLRDLVSLPDVQVHHPRQLDATRHNGLAVTTVARTLLDNAGALPFDDLRRAVAEADHLRLLDIEAIDAILGRGRRGAAALRRAIKAHLPELARTLSPLEERFLFLCEQHDLPIPEVNVKVAGLMVDCLWRDGRVVAELDGRAGHDYPAAIERDRRRDLTLRTAGYLILRYTWAQVTGAPERVVADLRAALAN